MKPRHLCNLLILLFLFMSCSETPRYTIGVSQCSDDGWRKKVNREIRIGQYQYGDVEVRITNADNKDDRQVRQIDSLVREKVDLLVVAPSNIETVTPAIDRALRPQDGFTQLYGLHRVGQRGDRTYHRKVHCRQS